MMVLVSQFSALEVGRLRELSFRPVFLVPIKDLPFQIAPTKHQIRHHHRSTRNSARRKKVCALYLTNFGPWSPTTTPYPLMVHHTFVWWRERQTWTELGYYGVFSVVSSRLIRKTLEFYYRNFEACKNPI
jgi:hypothetical protein